MLDAVKLSSEDFRTSLSAVTQIPISGLFGQDSEWIDVVSDLPTYYDTVSKLQEQYLRSMSCRCNRVMLFIQRASKPGKYRHLLLRSKHR